MPMVIADGSAIQLDNISYATLRQILWEGLRTGLPAGVTVKMSGSATQWIEFTTPVTSGMTVTINPANASQLYP